MAAANRQTQAEPPMPPGLGTTIEMVGGLPVEQTSIAARNMAPDEVTVRFTKWHAHSTTAYQKGSYAGFPRHVALKLIVSGVAVFAMGPAEVRELAHQAYGMPGALITK